MGEGPEKGLELAQFGLKLAEIGEIGTAKYGRAYGRVISPYSVWLYTAI